MSVRHGGKLKNNAYKEEDVEMSEKVEITKEEYDELVADQKFLNALFAGGVDNWDGYEMALDMLEDE